LCDGALKGKEEEEEEEEGEEEEEEEEEEDGSCDNLSIRKEINQGRHTRTILLV
jgi:hypothetical protein